MEVFKAQLEKLVAQFAGLGSTHLDMAATMHACADTIVRNNAADQGHEYRLPDEFQNAPPTDDTGGTDPA